MAVRVILCMSYNFGPPFRQTCPVKTATSVTAAQVVQASEQPTPRPVVKIPESCTAYGTPRMKDWWQNQPMLVLWRNGARRKIVMISLPSSAKEHDKFQSMVCYVKENEPERPHGEVSATPSNEPAMRLAAVILSAMAGNGVGVDALYRGEKKLSAKAARFAGKDSQL